MWKILAVVLFLILPTISSIVAWIEESSESSGRAKWYSFLLVAILQAVGIVSAWLWRL